MFKYILFLSLPILVYSTELPDWVKSKPSGYMNDYKLCASYGDENFSIGEQKALETCIKEISLVEGLHIGKSQTEYNRRNEKLEIKSNIKYVTDPSYIQGFQVREKYFGYDEFKSKETYILVSYPKTEMINLPSMRELEIKQFIFPGWGELSIGENSKGQIRAFNSALFLIGAVSAYFIMNDAYGDARDSKLQEDRKIYREKADFYRNWYIGCSLTYLIHSFYSTLDIKNSDYLTKYL